MENSMIISTFSSLKISKDKIYKNKQRKKIIISTFSSVLQKVFGKIDHEAKFPRLVLSVPRPSSARFLLFSSLATCGGIRTDSRRSYRIARLSSIPWLAMESRIVYGVLTSWFPSIRRSIAGKTRIPEHEHHLQRARNSVEIQTLIVFINNTCTVL